MQFCSNSVYIPFRGNHLPRYKLIQSHGGSELLSRRLSQCYLMLIIMVFNAFDTCTWCRKSCIFDVSDQFVSLASIPFRISKKRSSNPSGTYVAGSSVWCWNSLAIAVSFIAFRSSNVLWLIMSNHLLSQSKQHLA